MTKLSWKDTQNSINVIKSEQFGLGRWFSSSQPPPYPHSHHPNTHLFALPFFSFFSLTLSFSLVLQSRLGKPLIICSASLHCHRGRLRVARWMALLLPPGDSARRKVLCSSLTFSDSCLYGWPCGNSFISPLTCGLWSPQMKTSLGVIPHLGWFLGHLCAVLRWSPVMIQLLCPVALFWCTIPPWSPTWLVSQGISSWSRNPSLFPSHGSQTARPRLP